MTTEKSFSPGRRKLLIGGLGVAGLGIFAAAWKPLTNYRAAWAERVVRENLPGVTLDGESLKTFVQHILTVERMQPVAVKATVFADRFVPWLPAQISKARDGLEGLERHVLTEYLLGSNFFRVPDPKKETITFYGPVIACSNPFTHAVS